MQEIKAAITSKHPNTSKKFASKDNMVFPDSGASICLGGTCYLGPPRLKEKDLILPSKIVKAVDGLNCNAKGGYRLNLMWEDSSPNNPSISAIK